MKRFIILLTLSLVFPFWAVAQNCGLESNIRLPRNTTTTHTISVGNYLQDNLADGSQGVCAVNIFFLHHWVRDLEIDLISPAGDLVTLVGPDIDSNQGTIGSLFNISFVRCDSATQTQFPFGNQFDNNEDIIPGSYKGSYHPFNGCLEDFNTGSIIGDWTLVIRDFSDNLINGSEIFDFSIVFCDDSGNPCCFADAGRLVLNTPYVACPGDPILNSTLPGGIIAEAAYPIGNIRPDENTYNYTYLISRSDSIIARQDTVDLTSFSGGDYQVCGLSYLRTDSLSLPVTDGSITLDSLLRDIEGATPSFCADLTNNCIQVVINDNSIPTDLVGTICEGNIFTVGDSTFNQSGTYQIPFLNSNGCDSLVNLQLSVIPPTFDTTFASLCRGDSIELGSTFYSETGFYSETLQSVASCDSFVFLDLTIIEPIVENIQATICAGDSIVIGNQAFNTTGTFEVNLLSQMNCDSIINLDLTVLEVTSIILPPDTLNCNAAQIQLDGSTSSGSSLLSFQWFSTLGGSLGNSPTISVNQPDTYWLEVSVSNNGTTCTHIDTVIVPLNEVFPIADAGSTATIDCNQPEATIGGINTSQGPNFTYSWTTMDGNFNSATDIAFPVINSGGAYTLIVTDISNGCRDTAKMQVTSNIVFPFVDAGPDQTLDCIATEVTLDGTGSEQRSSISFEWGSDNGSVIQNPNTLIPFVNTPDRYWLVSTDNDNGCVDTAFVVVSADLNLPDITITPPGVLNCDVMSLQLESNISNAGNNFSINWTASQGGNIIQNGDTPNPTIDAAGSYEILVTNNDNGCFSSENITVIDSMTQINVQATPSGEISCLNSSIIIDGTGSSIGTDIVYNWSTPNGQIVGSNDQINVEVDLPGTYQFIVTDTFTRCTAETTVTVTGNITAPIAEAGSDTSLNCANPAITLDGTGSSIDLLLPNNFSYLWTGPGNITNEQELIAQTNGPGTYFLTVTNTLNGCIAVDSVIILEDIEVPSLTSITNNGFLTCENPEIEVSVVASSLDNDLAFSWTGPGSISDSTIAAPTVDLPGLYTVTIIDLSSQCSIQADITVDGNISNPVADAGNNLNIDCNNPQVLLGGPNSSVGGDIVYQWFTNEGNITGSTDQSTATVDTPGVYGLIVLDSQNGCADTSLVTVVDSTIVPFIDLGPDLIFNCTDSTLLLEPVNLEANNNLNITWNGPCIIAPSNEPSVLVDCPGTYTIRVENLLTGCFNIDTLEVLTDPNVPSIILPDSAFISCISGTILLDGSNSNGGNVQWLLDGSPTSLTSLTPTVDTAGLYTLVLENLVSGCTASDSITVILDCDPFLTLVSTPDSISCFSRAVNIETSVSPSEPNYEFNWVAPASNCFVAGQNTLTPTVSCPGIYQLIATNPALSLSDTLTVEIFGNLDIPILDILPPDTITCNTPSIILDASASSSGTGIAYTWINESGETLGDQSVITTSIGGQYTLEIFNNVNGCSNIGFVDVIENTVTPNISIGEELFDCFLDSFLIRTSIFPVGPAYSIDWNGTGIISATDSSDIWVNQPGNFEITVVNLSNGCVSMDTANVIQPFCPPCIAIDPLDTLTCNAPTMTINASFCEPCNNCMVSWTTSDGNIISGATTLTPLVDASGTYTITATSENGLTTIQNVVVIADQTPPPADGGPDQVLTCVVNSVEIGTSSNDPFLYEWNEENQNIILSTNATVNIDQPGSYVLSVLNPVNGCVAMDTVDVNIDTLLPTIAILEPAEINCISSQVNLLANLSSSNPNLSFEWTGPNGSNIIGNTTLNPLVDAPGVYTLTVQNANNGCRDFTTTEVLLNTSIPPILPIADDTLNCRDSIIVLTGNAPNPTGYSFEWCLIEDSGNAVNCTNEIDQTISQPGLYQFTLIDDQNGCSNQLQIQVIEQMEFPVVTLPNDSNLTCSITSIEIIPATNSINNTPTFQWTNSSTGLQVSTSETLTVTEPGNYQLNVTNTDNFCSTQNEILIGIDTISPIANAGPDTIINCTNPEITLIGNANNINDNLEFNWTTIGGNIISVTDGKNPIINSPGTYTFEVINRNNGCQNQDQLNVISNFTSPQIVLPDNNNLVINCNTNAIALDASNSMDANGMGITYNWEQTLGSSGLIGNLSAPIIQIIEGGDYQLIITDNFNGCTDTTTIVVNEDFAIPQIETNADGIINCVTSSVTIATNILSNLNNFETSWTDSEGNILAQNSLTIEAIADGDYTFTIQNSDNGCVNSTITTVTVDTISPNVEIMPSSILDCVVREIEIESNLLSEASNLEYQWSSTNGNITSSATDRNILVSSPGNYQLLVTNPTNGCVQSLSTSVIEIASPIEGSSIFTLDPNCDNPNSGQINIQEVFSGTEPFTYSIDNNVFITSNQFNNLSSGNYNLAIQGSDGCVWDTLITIFPPATISVDLGPDQEITLGDSITINAVVFGSDLETISWNPNPDSLNNNNTSINVKPFENTLYEVTVINEDGCIATDKIQVKVVENRDVLIPSAFSPNRDGENDLFTIYSNGNIRNVNLLNIYTRWGALVYTQTNFPPNNPTIGWDGTYNGEPLNAAVFVYYAEIEFIDGTIKVFQGDIALLK